MAALLLRGLGRTLRFEERNAQDARPADRHPDEAAVYVFWHRALLLAAYRYRDLGIRILISASFDGELIARVVERLGFVAVRGSSSRGGAAGLLMLTRARRAGHKVAITADGPRGPMYVAKPGAAAVVQHTGSATGCFHLHAEQAWLLRSWDRFILPKPFSRIRVSWSAPLQVESGEDGTKRLQESLDEAVARAEAS
ncbi:MAG: lysophospholipid acyltransferase family protein [Janthinobacterium lividum]